MLSRSSLETQKLELMSAMSELKLQQAALERENLELRATHLNNNTLSIERQPILTAGRIRTNSTSALHSSQNNILSSSGTIPKVRLTNGRIIIKLIWIYKLFQTPPSSYRRQVDIQYNSLPRPSFPNSPASNNSTLNSSGRAPSSSTNSSLSTTIDSNANPKQRNVAFGKQITNHLPYSASKSATNIYHHQLVLYQHPEPTPSIPSPPISHSFQQKQRGVSVPNLGF